MTSKELMQPTATDGNKDADSQEVMQRKVGTGNLSVMGLIEPFFARKWSIIIPLLASMLLGWLAIVVWPRWYRSEAMVLIKIGRESVSLDPTATTSQTLMFQKTQEEEINSALELIGSRYIKQLAVEELGADAIMNGHLPGEGSEDSALREFVLETKCIAADWVYNALVFAGIKDPLSDEEMAVMRLEKTLSVSAPKKSAIITVSAVSKSPEMAQAIARSTIENFQEQHLKTSRMDGSQNFFAEQAAAAEQELNERLDKLSAMLQKRDIASVESKRQEILSSLASIERTMRNRLNDLELQEVELVSRYKPDHPKVTRLRRELDETRLAVNAMQLDVEGTRLPNVIPVAGHTPIPQAQSGASERLIEQKQRLESELRELMNFQLEVDDVEREVEVARGRLQNLREKQEEARIIDELQSMHISNVSMIQPPSFVQRPKTPQKKLFAAGFTALGLLGGLGLVLLREFSSDKIRTLEQLKALGIDPHTVSLPRRSQLLSKMKRYGNKNERPFRKPSPVRSPLRSALVESIAADCLNPREGVIVGVIGVDENVGASTVAAGLALLADGQGMDAILVDADSSQRTLTNLFSATTEPQFDRVLAGEIALADSADQPTKGSLRCLDATTRSRVIERSEAKRLERWLRDNYDVAVVDLPLRRGANRVFDDGMLNSVILVAEADRTSSDQLMRTMQKLQANNVTISSVVLNKTRRTVPRWLERLFR